MDPYFFFIEFIILILFDDDINAEIRSGRGIRCKNKEEYAYVIKYRRVWKMIGND